MPSFSCLNPKKCLTFQPVLNRTGLYFIPTFQWETIMRYWQQRLEWTCEEKNVSFRRVSPWNTSRMCSSCGHTDKKNRNGENFLCQNCGYIDNADLNAAKNILERFLSGPYGAGCQAKEVDICLHF